MSMDADEESDEGIVPMKRSNNEGVSSAETVEGRTSPKGNGGQTAAARTQRQDTASNGLTWAPHTGTIRESFESLLVPLWLRASPSNVIETLQIIQPGHVPGDGVARR